MKLSNTKREVNFSISQISSPDQLFTEHHLQENLHYARLLVVGNGSGKIWIDLQPYSINTCCVFIIKPKQLLVLENATINGFLLSFTDSSMEADDESCDSDNQVRLLRFFSKQMLLLDPEVMDDLAETLCKMIKEINNENLYRAELLKRYFKILLIYMIRQPDSQEEMGQKHNVELVERFLSLLEKNFTVNKMVSDYALALFVSPNYLNQIVKKVTGDSAGALIRKRVMLEAKRKAVFSDRSMKEIGYMLGFDDPAHFSKLFKKTTGINFADFRKELLPIPCIPEM